MAGGVSGRVSSSLADSRRSLKALGRRLAADLAEVGASVEAPQGGFYLFPDLTPLRESIAARGIGTSEELCRRLLNLLTDATLTSLR